MSTDSAPPGRYARELFASVDAALSAAPASRGGDVDSSVTVAIGLGDGIADARFSVTARGVRELNPGEPSSAAFARYLDEATLRHIFEKRISAVDALRRGTLAIAGVDADAAKVLRAAFAAAKRLRSATGGALPADRKSVV